MSTNLPKKAGEVARLISGLPDEEAFTTVVRILTESRNSGKVKEFWVPDVFSLLQRFSPEKRYEANRTLGLSTRQQSREWWVAKNQDVADWHKGVEWDNFSSLFIKAQMREWFRINGKKVTQTNEVPMEVLFALFSRMFIVVQEYFVKFHLPRLIEKLDQTLLDLIDYYTWPYLEKQISNEVISQIRQKASESDLIYHGSSDLFSKILAGVVDEDGKPKRFRDFTVADAQKFLQHSLPALHSNLHLHSHTIESPTIVKVFLEKIPAPFFDRAALCSITTETAPILKERLRDVCARDALMKVLKKNRSLPIVQFIAQEVKDYFNKPADFLEVELLMIAHIYSAQNGQIVECTNAPILGKFLRKVVVEQLGHLNRTMVRANIVDISFRVKTQTFPLRVHIENISEKFNVDTLDGVHKVHGLFYNCDSGINLEFIQKSFAAHGIAIVPSLTEWLWNTSSSSTTKEMAPKILEISPELRVKLLEDTSLSQLWEEDAHEHYGETIGKRNRSQFDNPSFECCLCCVVYYHKVCTTARTTTCGHIFCGDCLSQAQGRSTNACPVCRTKCGTITLPAPVPQRSAVDALLKRIRKQ